MLRDTRFQRFEVSPLTGALGAEVRGIDLGAEPGDAAFEDLRRALHEHHVLAVREQRLDPHSLHRVARRFGPFSGNPIHGPMEGFDDIVRFVREPDDTGKVIGEDWHMDLAWLPRPPGITMLYGEVIPPVGGDTCFASLEQAYNALSPGMKALLGPLTAVHSGKGVYAINAAHKRLAVRSDAQSSDTVEVEHPVICAHPATGRPYVFVSSVLQRFKGMTEAETKPIVDYLVGLATRPEFTCRVRWEEGTLTIWDNPVLLHTAINDYPGYRRVTYRTTVEGWVPQAAPPETDAASNRAA
jgi:taurine dioxygenase